MPDPTPAPTPSPTPTPAPTPTPTPAWHEGIDADTLGFWNNKGYKVDDPKALATELTKQYRAAEKHIGAPPDRVLRLPADANDKAGWNEIFGRLGVPGEAKDYDLSGIKFANGNDLDAAFTDTLRGALHSARVPKDQAAGVVKAFVKHLDDAEAAKTAVNAGKVAEQKAKLKADWKENYDFNHLKAMEGARRLGIAPEAVQALENQIGYAAVMDAMRKIGANTSEDTWVDGRAGPGAGQPTTAAGAQARLNELTADPAWGKRLTSGDAQAKQEWDALTRMITPAAA